MSTINNNDNRYQERRAEQRRADKKQAHQKAQQSSQTEALKFRASYQARIAEKAGQKNQADLQNKNLKEDQNWLSRIVGQQKKDKVVNERHLDRLKESKESKVDEKKQEDDQKELNTDSKKQTTQESEKKADNQRVEGVLDQQSQDGQGGGGGHGGGRQDQNHEQDESSAEKVDGLTDKESQALSEHKQESTVFGQTLKRVQAIKEHAGQSSQQGQQDLSQQDIDLMIQSVTKKIDLMNQDFWEFTIDDGGLLMGLVIQLKKTSSGLQIQLLCPTDKLRDMIILERPQILQRFQARSSSVTKIEIKSTQKSQRV